MTILEKRQEHHVSMAIDRGYGRMDAIISRVGRKNSETIETLLFG
jgi:hypothetical protein